MALQTILHGGQQFATDETTHALAVTPVLPEIKHAAIDCAASGDNTLLAAVPGKAHCVLNMHCQIGDGATGTLYSGPSATGTKLQGAVPPDADGGGFVLGGKDQSGVPWFETAVGEALVLNLSAAIQASGSLTYFEQEG